MDLIGYKKIVAPGGSTYAGPYYIAKLHIPCNADVRYELHGVGHIRPADRVPEEAGKSGAFLSGRKMRASCAKVVAIERVKRGARPLSSRAQIGLSMHDRSFVYETGCTVYPRDAFNTQAYEDCGSGIHFFRRRDDAVRYS